MMHDEISELRKILADRQQQLYGLDVIEKAIEKIGSLKRDLSTRASASATAEINLDHALISQLLEHTIIYVYYGKPDIGRQAALKTKLQVASEQIETEKQLELVIVLGIILSIALTIMLVRFFNQAAGNRLATIAKNISRFAANEALLPEVSGSDEIAALDHFFHKTAAEVREMLQRESAVIENSCDIICSIDQSNRFAFINPAVQDIWGYSRNELPGLSVTAFLSADDLRDTTAHFQKVIESHDPVTFENQVKKADGSLADMQWSCQWSESEKLIFCVLQDITARKQVDRLKQEFVAIVSHDLRTPITASATFLELLDVGVYGELSPRGQLDLEKNAEGLQSLSDLVIDLLDIERLESGKLELELLPGHLSQLIEIAYDKVENHAVRNNIRFDIQYIEDDPPVLLDEKRTEQVLINLFACAIKLSQRRSYVRISQEQRDGIVKVNVALDAATTSAAITDAIFEPYRISEIPAAVDCGGRNLGLPLCKAIITKLGGKIGVEQPDRNRLTFWLQLPVADSSGQSLTISGASIVVMDKATGA
jgi:PAS domain S-box-containing protein